MKNSKQSLDSIRKNQALFIGHKDKLQVLANPYANIKVRVDINHRNGIFSSHDGNSVGLSSKFEKFGDSSF